MNIWDELSEGEDTQLCILYTDQVNVDELNFVH